MQSLGRSVCLGVVLALSGTACGLQSVDQAPVGDAASEAGGVARGPVTIRYTTVSLQGRYAPHNVGAAWIEDASGRFIRTLDHWGFLRATVLTAWLTASGGNQVDAISTATARDYGPRVDVWDMTDADGNPVPDGIYVLKIELTDELSAGPVSSIPVRKAPDATDTTLPNQPHLVDISLDYP